MPRVIDRDLVQWKTSLDRLLASSHSRDPARLLPEICDLAERMGEEYAEAFLRAFPELFEHTPALTLANYQRVVAEETVDAARLIEAGPVGTGGAIGDLLGASARRVYDRVADLFAYVDFSHARRFIAVGCGPLPVTIFHVYDRTTVPEIVGLDVRTEAVDTVRAAIARLGLSRLRAELCHGQEFDYSRADIVFVAGMVAGKAATLSRILATAPADAQIILREPYSLGRLWTESAEADLDQRVEIVGRGDGSRYLTRNLFLRRRPLAA
jgi:hypothetical protein